MKPVHQTKFGGEGNCLNACLASIFEVPIESLPEWDEHSNWYEVLTRYMVDTFGVQPIEVHLKHIAPEDFWIPAMGYSSDVYWAPLEGYYMVNGKSERGLEHSVVAKGGHYVHDPHPDGSYFGENLPRSFTFFVVVDPSKAGATP